MIPIGAAGPCCGHLAAGHERGEVARPSELRGRQRLMGAGAELFLKTKTPFLHFFVFRARRRFGLFETHTITPLSTATTNCAACGAISPLPRFLHAPKFGPPVAPWLSRIPLLARTALLRYARPLPSRLSAHLNSCIFGIPAAMPMRWALAHGERLVSGRTGGPDHDHAPLPTAFNRTPSPATDPPGVGRPPRTLGCPAIAAARPIPLGCEPLPVVRRADPNGAPSRPTRRCAGLLAPRGFKTRRLVHRLRGG